jgi:hypothetical protein
MKRYDFVLAPSASGEIRDGSCRGGTPEGGRVRRVGRWLTLACVLAAPLAAPGVAHAVDDKTMPGSECVPSTGNDPDGPRFRLVNSMFINASPTESVRADCPIVKERVGKGIVGASVFVVDNNAAEDVACELFSEQVAANRTTIQRIGPTSATSGASGFTRQVNLGGLSAAPGNGSYWFIGCTVPPNSAILSYYVNEQQ